MCRTSQSFQNSRWFEKLLLEKCMKVYVDTKKFASSFTLLHIHVESYPSIKIFRVTSLNIEYFLPKSGKGPNDAPFIYKLTWNRIISSSKGEALMLP